jgi:hypothetical protein
MHANSFAIDFFGPSFTDDEYSGFFHICQQKGNGPTATELYKLLLDGKNGRTAYVDSIGWHGNFFPSAGPPPPVYDINNDGRDEADLSCINEL